MLSTYKIKRKCTCRKREVWEGDEGPCSVCWCTAMFGVMIDTVLPRPPKSQCECVLYWVRLYNPPL